MPGLFDALDEAFWRYAATRLSEEMPVPSVPAVDPSPEPPKGQDVVPNPTLKDLIDAYRATNDKVAAVQEQVNKLQLDALVKQRDALAKSLIPQLEADWPYELDADHKIVKRRGWFGYKLQVVPTGYMPVVNPPTAWNQALRTIATVVVTVALTSGLPNGCNFPAPGPTPTPTPGPTPAPNNLTDAMKAGRNWAGYLLSKAAASFQTAASDIAVQNKPIDQAKADHVARLKDLAKGAPDTEFTKLLDQVIPPGSDISKATDAQKKQYGGVLTEIGDGVKSAVPTNN